MEREENKTCDNCKESGKVTFVRLEAYGCDLCDACLSTS